MPDKVPELTRVAMVSYYNTWPFAYGFENASPARFLPILDIPSKCISYFDSGEVDIALVPIATILNRDDVDIITDYCIGCMGAVRTVCLFADQAIEDISKIYLDKDSRSSQLLTKILVAKYWKIDVKYEEVDLSHATSFSLGRGEAVLMIGDKVFSEGKKYKFEYDLGLEWYHMTKLPFVFAVWIARKGVNPNITKELNHLLGFGVQNIDKMLSQVKHPPSGMNLRKYFKQYIDYQYDFKKANAISFFKRMAVEI